MTRTPVHHKKSRDTSTMPGRPSLIFAYTDYAGLGIPVDSAVALRTVKREMLVPVKHWSLWGESGFSVLTCDRDYSVKIDTPI